MTQGYVFRGERTPFTADPKDQRAREQAIREAQQLVNEEPPVADEELAHDAEIERRIDDYQVGGLDAFGTTAADPSWDTTAEGDQSLPDAASEDAARMRSAD